MSAGVRDPEAGDVERPHTASHGLGGYGCEATADRFHRRRFECTATTWLTEHCPSIPIAARWSPCSHRAAQMPRDEDQLWSLERTWYSRYAAIPPKMRMGIHRGDGSRIVVSNPPRTNPTVTSTKTLNGTYGTCPMRFPPQVRSETAATCQHNMRWRCAKETPACDHGVLAFPFAPPGKAPPDLVRRNHISATLQ
jgi:hypothetical protein